MAEETTNITKSPTTDQQDYTKSALSVGGRRLEATYLDASYTTTDGNTTTTTEQHFNYHEAKEDIRDGLQTALTVDQMEAVNSGVTAEKVNAYDVHIGDTSNPHQVTASQVNLGNVVNTGDSDTPTSGGTTKFTTGGAYKLQTAINTNKTNISKAVSDLNIEIADRTEADADLQTQINEIVEQGTGVTKFGGQTGEITVGKGLTMGADDAAKTVLVNGTGICYTTAGTGAAYTVTIPGITELYDGLVIKVKFHTNATTSACTLNVNGLGAEKMYYRYGTTSIKNFYVNYIEDLTYVSGYGWVCDYAYDSGNTYDRAITSSIALKVAADTPANRVVFTTKDGDLVPVYNANGYQTNISVDLTEPIYSIDGSAQVATGSYVNGKVLYRYRYGTLTYKYLTSTSPSWTKGDEIYAVFVSDGNGYFKLASDVTPITTTLPSETDATHYYCLVGIASSTTNFVLPIDHPVYTFIDGTKQPLKIGLPENNLVVDLGVAYSGTLTDAQLGLLANNDQAVINWSGYRLAKSYHSDTDLSYLATIKEDQDVGSIRIEINRSDKTYTATIDIGELVPHDHSSADTSYGVGTSTLYGHNKLISGDLGNNRKYTDGESAAASHNHDSAYVNVSGDTMSGDLTIEGNLTVKGTTTTVDSQSLKVTDQLIEVAKDNTAKLTSPAGIVVPKYDGTNYGALVYDGDGTAYVGDVNLVNNLIDVSTSDLQPLVTRNKTTMTDKGVTYWDATNTRINTTGKGTTTQVISAASDGTPQWVESITLTAGSIIGSIEYNDNGTTKTWGGNDVLTLSTNYVDKAGAQTISGKKTFSGGAAITNLTTSGNRPTYNSSELALKSEIPDTSNMVDTTSEQTISGEKTFENKVIIKSADNTFWIVEGNESSGNAYKLYLPTPSNLADGTIALTSDIPTKTSQLTNDSGYITSLPSDLAHQNSANTFSAANTFSGQVNLTGKLTDKDGDAGTANQILTSTGSAVDWKSASDLFTDTNTTYDLAVDGSNIKLTGSDGTNDSIEVPFAKTAEQDKNGNIITDTYVAKSGDTMTGALNVPTINGNNDTIQRTISTGTNGNSYFQARKFRGEGTAASYYHAVDFGYANHNQVDFYEYGGVYNFWQNQTATATTSTANKVASLQLGKLVERGNTLTYPNKSGTIAVQEDFATVATSGSYNDLTDKPTIPTNTTYDLVADTTNKQIKLVGSDSSEDAITVPYATNAGTAEQADAAANADVAKADINGLEFTTGYARLAYTNTFTAADNRFNNPLYVGTPTADGHAATKKYVDDKVASVKVKYITSTDAATTPKDVTWYSGTTLITGTLVASVDTANTVYFVPCVHTSGGTQKGYDEYMTVEKASGDTTTYAWEAIGNTQDIDLSNYVNSLTQTGSGVVTDISKSGNEITVTKTDLTVSSPSVSGYTTGFVDNVSQAANGKITVSRKAIPQASTTEYGIVKIGSATRQTVAANTVTATADRTYAIQNNSNGQLVVNVPWTNEGKTYTAGTHITISDDNAISAAWPTSSDSGYAGINKTGTVTSIASGDGLSGGTITGTGTISHATPTGAAATTSGLYKITTDKFGHVTGTTAVAKTDITALGIPAADTNTTYTIGISGTTVTLTPNSGTAQTITVPYATKATQDASGNVITTTYAQLTQLPQVVR